MALGTIAGGLPSKNNGIGYDPTRKKVVAGPLGGLGTPRTSMVGGVMDTLNARLTNQASGAVNAAIASKQPTQFSYNADADPVYQAAIRRAQANAATASGNAQAEMNRRGILNSTITGDRIAQIEQSEMGRVSDTILPQLEAQAYGRYRDTIDDQYRDKQFSLQEGQLTGTYKPSELMDQYDIVAQAKQDYANAKTPEERIAARQKADAARGVITQLGGDASLVGSNVTLDQARGNQGKFGIQTQSAREFDSTMAYNKDRDKRGDFESDRAFDYGVTRDKRGDFENDRAYNRGVFENDRGFNRGVFENDRAFDRGVFENDRGFNQNVLESDRNYDLALDDNDRAWVDLDDKMSQSSGEKSVSGSVAGSMLGNSLQKVIGTDDDGKPVYGTVNNPETRKKLFVEAWNASGVAPGQDTIEMLTKAGYTTAEIATLKKDYPEAFGGK